MEIIEIQNMYGLGTARAEVKEKEVTQESSEDRKLFSEILNDKKETCPYSSLAKDGIIEYNGVVFVCDYKTNSICLGDMSNQSEILNISLPSGGHLKVNVNNLEQLTDAIGMFKGEDLNAVLRAIAQYKHYASKVHEMQEEMKDTVENLTEEEPIPEEESISGDK